MTLRSRIPANLQTYVPARPEIWLLIVAFCAVALLMIWLRPDKDGAAERAALPNVHRVVTVPVQSRTDEVLAPRGAPPEQGRAAGGPPDPNLHVVQTFRPPPSPIGPPPTGFNYVPQPLDQLQR